MYTNFKTPKVDVQNVISFTCSNEALENLLDLFDKLHTLGEIGSSKTIKIDWDGDGSERINNIAVNGMSLENWEKEWKRLEDIKKIYRTLNDETNETKENNNKDFKYPDNHKS